MNGTPLLLLKLSGGLDGKLHKFKGLQVITLFETSSVEPFETLATGYLYGAKFSLSIAEKNQKLREKNIWSTYQ